MFETVRLRKENKELREDLEYYQSLLITEQKRKVDLATTLKNAIFKLERLQDIEYKGISAEDKKVKRNVIINELDKDIKKELDSLRKQSSSNSTLYFESL